MENRPANPQGELYFNSSERHEVQALAVSLIYFPHEQEAIHQQESVDSSLSGEKLSSLNK
jgi:hypothetical protein